MKTPLIPFHSYSPDRIDAFQGASPAVQNVIPTVDGYRPLKTFTRFSENALTSRPRGLFSVKDDSNNGHIYAGDKTKLYKLLNTSFSDASSSVSGTYDLGASGVWEFTRFGNRIITSSPDFDHQPQQATIGSLTFSTTLITSADKPKMKHLTSLRDFVVGGNISSTAGGLTPSRVWWSAIRDAQDWTPNRTTQCDYQDLQFGGQVQRVVGSVEYAVVFQENVIRRMNYSGSPTVFEIDVVDQKRGTLIPTSVVDWGRFIFYIAPEGFMAFDGVESTPIGDNMMDDEFYDYFDSQQFGLVSSAVDPVLKNVFWSFPGEGNTGAANKVFVYHWPQRKWAVLDQMAPIIGNVTTPGYTLESLDNISGSIDDDVLLGPSLDADKWKGGVQKQAAMDAAGYFGYYDGANHAAFLDTAELELTPGGRSQVTAVRPVIQGSSGSGIKASVGQRSRLIDSVSFQSGSEINTDGMCMQRAEGRYQRFRISLSSSVTWSLVAGVQVEFESSGER